MHTRVLPEQLHVVFGAIDDAFVKNKSGGLSRVCPTMCSDDIVLSFLWIELARADKDGAVMENGGGVAENKVDVAFDDARFVELTKGMGVDSILITDEFAVFDDG